jgi:hypothetical protein
MLRQQPMSGNTGGESAITLGDHPISLRSQYLDGLAGYLIFCFYFIGERF